MASGDGSGSPGEPGVVPNAPSVPSALHVNDCASTTTQLVAEAGHRGWRWDYLPLASRSRTPRPVAGAAFAARLALGAATHDLLHVHYGSVVAHTRWTRRRYLLHLHGTDARTQQYEPRWTPVIRAGMADAAAVLYSTPDLAEHVLPHRADALLLPVPIDTSVLPPWTPTQRPTVVFSSRWEAVKGLADQLAVARAVRARRPDVDLVGVDWGPGAASAADAGVRLVPRTDRAGFLRLLARAHVVVGQCSGMLAASELEAVGIGVPVVAALDPRWYPPAAPGTHGTPEAPAVLGGAVPGSERVDVVSDAVLRALHDPAAAAARLQGPAWLARTHDVRLAADRLAALYRSLV